MKLSEIFSQFKIIRPDPNYAEKSKRIVLASPQMAVPAKERGIMVFFRALETGVALVLAGFFILLATGSFSGINSLAPVQYAVIDPNGLHAEAQAIDIQIQLANLDYSEVTSTSAESTTATASGAAARAFTAAGTGTATSTPSSTISGGTATSTPSSAALSVDQALKALSQ